MNDKKTILIAFFTFPLAALLFIFLISKVNFHAALSPAEQKVISFNYDNIPKVAERKQALVTSIRNPIVFAKPSHQEFPKVPLAQVAPPPSAENKVSFILINREKKLAIIDGKVVNEGDVIGNQRVTKIEKDKVLLKNREGEKWLKLD
ncbi:MAG: hypothetical protein FJ139_08390 [Deltaproteobacteria bacterium]|nr:hypothetical protein [Deltaproteobacteria bacterium]